MKRAICKLLVSLVLCAIVVGGTVMTAFAYEVPDGIDVVKVVHEDSGLVVDGFMVDVLVGTSTYESSTYEMGWFTRWQLSTAGTEKMLGISVANNPCQYAGLRLGELSGEDRHELNYMNPCEYEENGSLGWLNLEMYYGASFRWEPNTWYRQLVRCWQDAETGMTFVGVWYYDYQLEEWMLVSYYNTNLYDSYIMGGVEQVLCASNYNDYAQRSFRSRNFYYLSSNTWYSEDDFTIHTGNFGGTISTSSMEGDIWIGTNYNMGDKHMDGLLYLFDQPFKPSYGFPNLVVDSKEDNKLEWMTLGTPQLSYQLTVTDEAGYVVVKTLETRPEVCSVYLGDLDEGDYTYTLKVTDVFGQSVSVDGSIEIRHNQNQEKPNAPIIFKDPEIGSFASDAGSSVNLILIILAFVFMLMMMAGSVVAVIIVMKKIK